MPSKEQAKGAIAKKKGPVGPGSSSSRDDQTMEDTSKATLQLPQNCEWKISEFHLQNNQNQCQVWIWLLQDVTSAMPVESACGAMSSIVCVCVWWSHKP